MPTTQRLRRRRAATVLGAPFLAALGAACGAPSQPGGYSSAPDAAPTASGPAAVTPSTPLAEVAGARTVGDTLPATSLTFKVVPAESSATFRVREQLARVELPSDAVGTTKAVDGQLTLFTDGTIDRERSRVTVDLNQLATDSAQRDSFIKRNTLQTERFPVATFIPTHAEGLPRPLPESGQHAFKLTGQLNIHGVEREVTWDTNATREGNRLTGTATTAVKFGDFGMEPPRVPVVLSVVDEIRLELNLTALREA